MRAVDETRSLTPCGRKSNARAAYRGCSSDLMDWRTTATKPRTYMRRLHMYVHGRVQGVFFRVSVQERATGLGLTGWTRNRRDGSVEVVAEGDTEALQTLRSFCGQGPPGAFVREVDVIDEIATGEFFDFHLRSDA